MSMTSGSMGCEADGAVATVVGLTDIPDAIRRLATLSRPDYVDLFTITTSGATTSGATTSGVTDRSAEEWARVALEGTPAGRSAPLLWRLLGLRLGPTPSPHHVQGWKIADRGDDWIRIETSSWFMTAQAVVHVDDGRVSLALFLRYDRAIAALIWPPVSVVHRRGVPVILRQAVKAHARPRHLG